MRSKASPSGSRLLPVFTLAFISLLPSFFISAADRAQTLSGKAALGDWTTDAPGVRRRLSVTDLPPPNAAESVRNSPKLVKRPADAWPKVPEGFTVQEFASGLSNPRVIVTAPNGDFFVAESKSNRVRVIRDANS